MKKLMLAALAVFAFTFASAQEDGVRFGAKAGVNISNFSGEDTEGFDGRISLHLGGLVEIPLSDNLAFQPELLYSSQGSSVEASGIESVNKLDYLNIPLMLKYYLVEGLSLQVGPQIGVLLSAVTKIDGVDDTVNIKDGFNSADFAANFGLGYQLESGLFFDGRYSLGFSDLVKDRPDGDDGSLKNGNIQLSVGYKF